MARRSVISQLANAGEEALGQLAQNPVTRKALESAVQVKDRVEKLVTGLAAIEGRVSRIEKRLDALDKPKRSTSSSSSSKPPTSSSSKTTTRKSSSSR